MTHLVFIFIAIFGTASILDAATDFLDYRKAGHCFEIIFALCVPVYIFTLYLLFYGV